MDVSCILLENIMSRIFVVCILLHLSVASVAMIQMGSLEFLSPVDNVIDVMVSIILERKLDDNS